MAINPALLNPALYADPRPTPVPPGGLTENPAAAQPTRKRMRRFQVGDKYVYYDVGSPEAQRAGGLDVEVDAVVSHGYVESATTGQPVQPGTPAPPAATATAQSAAPAPAQPAAPAGPPALTTQPVPVEQQGGANVQASDQPGLQGAGPWVRISSAGNVLGVHIVRSDSPAAQQAMASGVRPVPALVGLRTTPVVPGLPSVQIPDELSLSPNFDAAHRTIAQASGGQGQIIAYDQIGVQDEAGQPAQGHKVTWRLPNGIEQSFTFRQQGDQMVVSGAPETNLTGYTGPDKAALERAQAAYQQASAAHQRAQAAHTQGQITAQELKNAKDLADQYERAYNSAAGLGNITHAEALEQRRTEATIGLTQAQTAAIAPNLQVAQQGAANQTFQNALQYFRDRVGDETKAWELATAFVNSQGATDIANNNLARAAAQNMVDAETSANTQRVSLANSRLSASNSGFSDDTRTAMDLNQYLEPGSERGADALMALQALRYANARKYGAFDVNDTDLKFDPNKIPIGIRAFANPEAPSFATRPNWDEVMSASDALATRFGGRERPEPIGFDPMRLQQPPAVAAAARTAAAAPAPAAARPTQPPAQSPGQAGMQSPAPPDYRGTPQVVGSERVQSPGQAGMMSPPAGDGNFTPSAMQPDGNERPDDVITLRSKSDPTRVNLMTRTEYEKRHPDADQYWEVVNAEPGSSYNFKNGVPIRKATPPAATPPPAFDPERGETSRTAPSSYGVTAHLAAPTAVADLTRPSAATQQAMRLLTPDPEEERRRREREQLMSRFGTPEAIYGMFEGAYPAIPTFF